MKRSGEFREQFVPWAGLVVGIVAAGTTHQFGAEGMFDNCAVISPVPLILVALLGIAATVAAALWSWGVARDGDEGPARRLVAIISVGAAALFVMAMTIPIIASLVIPPCFQ